MSLCLDDVVAAAGPLHIGPVSVTVEAGRIVGLIGPSGAGKTTIAAVAAGLHRPIRGTRLLDTVPTSRWGWSALATDRRRVQLVSQHPHKAVDPHLTLGESLTLPARLHRYPAGDPADWAERCQVPRALLTRRPAEVSGGQLQRLVLARALAVGPDYLIVDEPTTAQDAITTAAILDILTDAATAGVGILAISHDLPLIRHIAEGSATMPSSSSSSSE